MAAVVYALCAVTSMLVAGMLVRSYQRTRTRLLLWSSLCFVGLAVNNVMLFVDLVVVTQVDLSLPRQCAALAALFLLIIGLVWESR
jgi:hypothetical protein